MKRVLPFVLAVFVVVPALAEGGVPIVIGESRTIRSEILDEDRTFLVRVPTQYALSGERYPVLYMTDGGAQFFHTAGTVDFLSRNGLMPDMIVVAIANTDRNRDLTPTRTDLKLPDGTVRAMPTTGGADRFLDFIEKELMPFVDANYRTAPYRLFAGHSFGGLFAVHAFLSRPYLFKTVIAVSPSLHWDDRQPLREAAATFEKYDSLDRTLILTLGEEGDRMQEPFDAFQALLRKNAPDDLNWKVYEFKDEDHGSVVERSHYHALRWAHDGWRMPRDAAAGALPDLDTVKAHYASLSKRFGYDVDPPERQVNMLGYRYLGADRVDEAIAIFKHNVAAYPDSPNVYDSLGEAYERDGQLDLARRNYARAVELGTPAADPNLEVYRANHDRVAAQVAEAEGS